MRYGKLVAALALTAGLGFVAPASVAAQQPVPEQQETVEVTDELLERFVAVYPAVVNVAQATQNQLATAETPEEAQEIQVQAQERITALLDEGELTVVEYEAVVMRLNEDAEMRAEFERLLEEQERGGGGL